MEMGRSTAEKSELGALQVLQPVSRSSLSGEIIDQLIDLISREVLRPGERLPGERELCRQFGVGRTSLREALRSLTVMGILDGRVGKGTYVCNNRSYLEKTLRWGLIFDRKTVQDLTETRLMLEAQAAYFSAQRAKEDDLSEIERALMGMEESTDRLDEFLEFDLQFHLCIARATQNSIIDILLGMTRGYLKEWIKGVLAGPSAEAVEERVRLTLSQHRQIYQAIVEGRADEAREAMIEHILSSSLDAKRHF